MKKVLWFSRHKMSDEQLKDLKRILGSELEITKINGTAPNVHVPFTDADSNNQPALKELVVKFDESAMVLPINLQQQILPFLPSGRLLNAVSKRVITKGKDGEEDKVKFVFDGWDAITKIEVVKERL